MTLIEILASVGVLTGLTVLAWFVWRLSKIQKAHHAQPPSPH